MENYNNEINIDNKSTSEKKRKDISDYYEGGKYQGRIIKKIYFRNIEKKYMIIKTNDNAVRVCGASPTNISALLGECIALSEGIKVGKREWYDYQRALAINTYLLGEQESSEKILLELIYKLQQRVCVHKRLIYIGVYLFLVAIALFASIALSILWKSFPYTIYLKMATFGAIGGFISLNLKLNELKFEISESTSSYIMVSVYKMVFAMLTGLVSYFLIKSDLMLSAIKVNGELNKYLLYTIAILSGFSESLLPNIFKSIEADKGAKDNKEKTFVE